MVDDGRTHTVKQMTYTDPYGDMGLYTGEVDEESRPHGKGKMKYDNGVFYEGNWVHGKKDDDLGQTDMTRERILSGFTSWKGQKKNPKDGSSDKGQFVYGMDWVDTAGLAGKYTGHVDENETPSGDGVMRYEFGLVAKGKWIKGVLDDRVGMANGAATGVMPTGAMSVAPGMSVAGGGAQSVVSGLGMMSIGGGGMMGGFPQLGHHVPHMGPHTGPHLGHQVNPYHNANASVAASLASAYYNPMGAVGNSAAHQQPQAMMNPPDVYPPAPAGGNAVPTNILTSDN